MDPTDVNLAPNNVTVLLTIRLATQKAKIQNERKMVDIEKSKPDNDLSERDSRYTKVPKVKLIKKAENSPISVSIFYQRKME